MTKNSLNDIYIWILSCNLDHGIGISLVVWLKLHVVVIYSHILRHVCVNVCVRVRVRVCLIHSQYLK